MRYFLIFLILGIIALSAVFNGPAYSQRHAGYCDQAESTAATLDCVNRHNQAAKDKLSAAFKEIMQAQSEAARALLSEAQKSWIIYRDAHCAWESGLTDTPALKRVYELSCLTAMTDHRLGILEAVRLREEAPAPREFGSQPRWMNALAHDHPDIFWRHGEWKSADMDCDGEDEQIMTGISVNQIQEVKIDEKAVSEKARHEIEIVISISENPKTGRPRAKLLRLPVSKNQEGPHLCRPAIRLELKDMPPAQAEAMPAKSCKVLHVTDRSCAPVVIFWDGKDYALKTLSSKGDAL